MNAKKGLQRFYIQSILDECRQIIQMHKQINDCKTISLTYEDKQVFHHLGMSLKTFLSTIDNTITSVELANDYLDQPWINVSRLFFEKDRTRFRVDTIYRILDSCERTADEYIGCVEAVSN